MKQARLQRLLTIVDKALTLEAGERVRYLNDACGQNTMLRKEVEELLGSVGKSESFWEEWKEWNEQQIAELFRDTEKKDQTLTDRQFGHYRLVERLGAGGMGVVYRARDTRLKRNVAIKFLPPGWSLDERAKERFLHEARTAASLDHPNVCTIYEVNETEDGTLYIVMAFYEGETLRTRLEKGPVGIDDALNLALQTARGLAAAHAKGLVHRDIKPANLMITGGGTLKILDFGIAKAEDMTLTLPGQRVGTAAYMAPEQAAGKDVDGRADLWSLGVVFYEMLTGIRPADAAQMSRRIPPPSGYREEIPDAVDKLILRMLKERPGKRTERAEELVKVLEDHIPQAASGTAGATPVSRVLTRTVRWSIVALALAVLIPTTAFLWWRVHDSRVHSVRTEAIPQIERLADEYRTVEAFRLAENTPRLGLDDPVLDELMNRVSSPVRITSEPSGATVAYRDYRDPDSNFVLLGETPLEAVRAPIPTGLLLWRVEKDGYETLEAGETSVWRSLEFELRPEGEGPAGMMYVPAGSSLFGRAEAVDVPAFWLSTFEVTNREYQTFVDAGGYREPQYWTQAIEAAGEGFSWEEFMERFRDSTGQPGPATWSFGRYQDGTGDQPVRGVSWYEAVAFAELAGKSLPTVYHWRRAAPWNAYGDLLVLANTESEGPVAAGSSASVGRYGHYDMAGNVTEWVWNEAPGGQRYILGGSWREPRYTFTHNYARSPLEREPDFGFRLAAYDNLPPAELAGPMAVERHDFSKEVSVSDEIFDVFRSQFAYDPLPLEPQIESVDEAPQHWRRETVSFTAAYDGERMIAHLFLPRDVEPPYKTVVYVPGASARMVPSIDDMGTDPGFFIPRSGRALVWPAYSGMLERGGGLVEIYQSPREQRDRYIRMVNDLQRTVDYLKTRDDIDGDNLGYFGLSIGGEYGPLFTAIEERFRALAYLAGGYDDFHMLDEPAEIQPWNYAPRVTTPTLMINGASDYGIPVGTAQKPMFDALGVPPEHKRHVILEGGHMPYDMNEVIREILDWFDRYQGSPTPAPTTETEATASHSLAVLPFANTSPDAENEYFADGVTDEILTHLAQVPDFSVISRTTTMSYKGTDKSIPQIAEELGVGYVLEGNVRRAGNRVRITARLVDSRTDRPLWGESYDRQIEDIFAVQSEIAQSIAQTLEVELSGEVASRIERRPTDDLEAYELFLLGRENHYRYNREGNERAMELFRRALERDSEFTLARAWLARALVAYSVNHGMGASWADLAVVEARQAVTQQPDLADAHTALGAALTFSAQYEAAVFALKRALTLNPNDWAGARYLGIAYTKLGAWDEGIRVTRRALDLEGVRLTSPLHSNLAWYTLQLGLLDQAQAAIETATIIEPKNPSTLANRAWIELSQGRLDTSLRATERLAEFASEVPSAGVRAAELFIRHGEFERARDVATIVYEKSPRAYPYHESHLLGALYGYTLEQTGEPEHSREVLAETEHYAMERIAVGDELNALRYSLAAIHALRGEGDEAIHWLNEAIRYGWNVAAITAQDPLLENLHSDPRFQNALDRMEADLANQRERVEREGW